MGKKIKRRAIKRLRSRKQKPPNYTKKNVTWIASHLWHAKRFHMATKWGWRVPMFRNDKGVRVVYRAVHFISACQFVSTFNANQYFQCLLLISYIRVFLSAKITLGIYCGTSANHFMIGLLCNAVIYIFGAVTILCIIKKIISFAYIVYAYRLRQYFGGPTDLTELVDSKRYALITGSTDGIGLVYAKVMAKIGFNIIIVGRSDTKIKAAIDTVSSVNSNITVKSLKIDFNDPDIDATYATIREQTENLEVAVLVNNVGVSYPHMTNFENVPNDLIDSIVRVNTISVVKMCQIFIPRMLAHNYKPIIINVSSYSAVSSLPFLAAYVASKAFVRGFSKSLSAEYHGRNLTIQCVMPLLISTKMVNNIKPSVFVAESNKFVEEAISTIGILSECCGCLSHHIQHLILSNTPDFIHRRMVLKAKEKIDRKLARISAEKPKNE
ncbi:hypothetical protein GJ496_004698 [Pomphorhynchus laevis]|nr:hypothetical protein GJ496_004698 [Pomphorhynchus laevis]